MTQFEIFKYKDKPESFYNSQIDSLFYSPQWLQVLSDTYGYEFYTALNPETNNFIIYTIIDNGFGKKLMSVPFSDYVKLKQNHLKEDIELLKFIEKSHPGIPVIYKSTHSSTEAMEWGNVLKKAYYHRIYTKDLEKVKELQPPTFRQKVKQAKKKGVSVRINKKASAVKDFYEIYHQLRFEKFESIPQPYSFFENMYKSFVAAGKGFFLEALYEEKVIASFIILECNNILYQKSGCSAKEYLKMRPNNLLYDFLINYAHENNYESIDLGLSGTGESYAGLVKFKDSLGGIRKDITYLHNDAAKQNEDAKALNDLISSMTSVIVSQKLDIETTDKFSKILYPFFA